VGVACGHGVVRRSYGGCSFSKEWGENLRVRAFSETMRTMSSGAPSGGVPTVLNLGEKAFWCLAIRSIDYEIESR